MVLRGTVINGVIVPDVPVLAEGARVWIELDDTDDSGSAGEPYDREQELAILRESIAEAAAGVGGVDAREFLKQLAAERNLPLELGE